MGYEHRLQIEVPNHAMADELLRGIDGFEKYDEKLGLYSFRRASTGAMPDVDAKIEAAGIYLCSYGGSFAIIEEIQAAFAASGLEGELVEL